MNAVIYCRVSSKDQVDGTSLGSQETACREYAVAHGMHVVRVFIEEGESAKFADRTQLLELLAFCRQRTHQIEALLVWKIDRFARNVEDHYTVKAALKKMGVRIVSVTEPIQADPSGQLLETILAGFAQFDNDVRALRTIQGMQQRIREGIWPWHPPLGYLPQRMGKKTQPDQTDPRTFAQLKRAWQLFGSGAYTMADIGRLLHSGGVLGYRGRPLSPQTLDHIFANQYYAGILRDPWSGEEHDGRHVRMVTRAEFATVQELRAERSNSDPRHRLTETFPVRGHVRCPTCESRMTGYFAMGKRKRYAYYKCFSKSCPTRTKSYSASAVHEEFVSCLADTAVPHYLSNDIIRELVGAYHDSTDRIRITANGMKQESEKVGSQLRELISMRAARLVTDEEFVAQSEQLRKERSQLEARASAVQPFLTTQEIGQLAGGLANLEATWRSLPPSAKRSFGELLFPVGYVFGRIRTPKKGLVFRTFGPNSDDDSNVAGFLRANLNTIIAEIRRFLAVVQKAENIESGGKAPIRRI
jgi:site-specific DNA recombinase